MQFFSLYNGVIKLKLSLTIPNLKWALFHWFQKLMNHIERRTLYAMKSLSLKFLFISKTTWLLNFELSGIGIENLLELAIPLKKRSLNDYVDDCTWKDDV